MKKINVMLYGIQDGKHKNRAEIVSCDKTGECSFYKRGCCLNVTSFFSKNCKYGNIAVINGYTRRAKKGVEFNSRYRSDELYGALKHPRDWRVALIDGVVLFNLTFAICDRQRWNNWNHEWEDLEEYRMRECGFSTGTYSYIPLEDLTVGVLNRIIKYRPQAMMGGEITNYQKNIVPNLLFELSKLLPDVYEKLIAEYPEVKNITPNFVGKNAYIYSLPDGAEFAVNNGKFVKNGDYVFCENYKSSFLPFGAKTAEVSIKISKDLTVKITNNNQIDEKTVFE